MSLCGNPYIYICFLVFLDETVQRNMNLFSDVHRPSLLAGIPCQAFSRRHRSGSLGFSSTSPEIEENVTSAIIANGSSRLSMLCTNYHSMFTHSMTFILPSQYYYFDIPRTVYWSSLLVHFGDKFCC